MKRSLNIIIAAVEKQFTMLCLLHVLYCAHFTRHITPDTKTSHITYFILLNFPFVFSYWKINYFVTCSKLVFNQSNKAIIYFTSGLFPHITATYTANKNCKLLAIIKWHRKFSIMVLWLKLFLKEITSMFYVYFIAGVILNISWSFTFCVVVAGFNCTHVGLDWMFIC